MHSRGEQAQPLQNKHKEPNGRVTQCIAVQRLARCFLDEYNRQWDMFQHIPTEPPSTGRRQIIDGITYASVFGSPNPTLFKPTVVRVRAFLRGFVKAPTCLIAERSCSLYPRIGACKVFAVVHFAHSNGASDSFGDVNGGAMMWAPMHEPGYLVDRHSTSFQSISAGEDCAGPELLTR